MGSEMCIRDRRLTARLVRAYGEELGMGHGLTHLFPTAERLLAAEARVLGIPERRAATVRALAAAAQEGVLAGESAANVEATRSALAALPGIGPWTVAYVAMRGLGEPDAFPAGDLALRRAAGGPLRAEAQLLLHAERWRPWRAYAAMALWWLDANAKTGG